jgi:hypothetical protein
MLTWPLFATTFYPLSVYPAGLRWVVECLPLYHAVELMRAFTTGVVGPGLVGHAVYFRGDGRAGRGGRRPPAEHPAAALGRVSGEPQVGQDLRRPA